MSSILLLVVHDGRNRLRLRPSDVHPEEGRDDGSSTPKTSFRFKIPFSTITS